MPDDNHFEPIKPADIPLTKAINPVPGQTKKTPPLDGARSGDALQSAANSPSRRWLYGAIFAALASVILLLAVSIYQPVAIQSNDSADSAGELGTTTSPPPLQESPFQQAQLAAARRSAQDILARVLEKKQALATMHIQQWAGDGYAQALSAANEGDLLYRDRQFETAIERYTWAETLLDELEAGREPLIAQRLSAGLAAINQGETEAALEAFEQVLLIDAEHPEARQGKQRCAVLPEVFAATERARARQTEGAYAKALDQYALALNLDPLFAAALAGRQEARDLLDSEQFQAAINQGFQHLQSVELSTAREFFQRALRLKPQSEVAQSALAQVDNEIAQRTIARLLSSAARDESQEQWQAALNTYEQILKRDGAVTAATVGKIRSSARQQLDSQLETFIHRPLRLASPGVYRAAQLSLADAQQIAAPGQRLEGQIETLGQILINAIKPQTVVLRSDNATRVSILKVGAFQPFSVKEIQLKPGQYIAEGIRPGFRDVRVEFVVTGANIAPVVVQCRETI